MFFELWKGRQKINISIINFQRLSYGLFNIVRIKKKPAIKKYNNYNGNKIQIL